MCPLISVRTSDTTSQLRFPLENLHQSPHSVSSRCTWSRLWILCIQCKIKTWKSKNFPIWEFVNPPQRTGQFRSPVPSSSNSWPSVIAFALQNAHQDGLRKAWNESKRKFQLTVSAPPCSNVYCEIYDYKKLIKKNASRIITVFWTTGIGYGMNEWG